MTKELKTSLTSGKQ